jgi:hypothetical protein
VGREKVKREIVNSEWESSVMKSLIIVDKRENRFFEYKKLSYFMASVENKFLYNGGLHSSLITHHS